jgi:cell division protein FtsQ
MSNVFALRDRTGRGEERSLSRWARRALVILSALCSLVLFARFAAVPIMEIRHVVVQSDMPLTDEQVLAISGIRGDEHWYSIATADIQKRLEANPLVRRAEVRRIFPNTVRMTVWGRQPAALVLAASAGRSLPVLVDGDGVVFKICTTSEEVDLPVITGLDVGETGLGAQLPHAYASLFANLRALRERAPSLFRLVSEVRILPPSSFAASVSSAEYGVLAERVLPYRDASFDVLLYLTNSPVPVRARGAIDESLLKYTLMVLDLLSKQGIVKDIQELDTRSGDVVYRVGARSTDAANGRSTDAALKGG